jgi:hypothetical protein
MQLYLSWTCEDGRLAYVMNFRDTILNWDALNEDEKIELSTVFSELVMKKVVVCRHLVFFSYIRFNSFR